MAQPHTTQQTGLYVDIENLSTRGQQMLVTLVDTWPPGFPPPHLLRLYTQAHHTTMWRLWASQAFPDLEVRASGTQHFNQHSSRNSADIAMSVQAMADLLQERVTHVAVFSDDCDFISLCQAILDEPAIPTPRDTAPFLWITTDRSNSVSVMVQKFFPTAQTHTVPWPPGPARDDPIPGPDDCLWTQAADLVAQQLPPGTFRSSDVLQVIQDHWPDHPLAVLDSGTFGQHMTTRIWPALQKMGATRTNSRYYLPPDLDHPRADTPVRQPEPGLGQTHPGPTPALPQEDQETQPQGESQPQDQREKEPRVQQDP